MADGGKVPLDLQLSSSVPLGIRAFRRRFTSPCTNLQTAGPDDYVNIYPDTSTPGSFIDPESTYIMADLKISNGNYCVDYTDFGVEGAGGALIQDWRVFNQGSILEEILEYGTVASTLCNLEGSYEQETSMYFSSKLKVGFQEEYHKNFIKPPMVDQTGNIMYGPNPLGMGLNFENGTGTFTGASSGTGNGELARPSGFMLSGSSCFVYQNVAADGSEIGATVATTQDDYLGNFGINNPVQTNAGGSWCTSDPPTGAAAFLTPMSWPDTFDPRTVSIVNKFTMAYGTINKPQIMANLCNVKCFPIGCTSAVAALSLSAVNSIHYAYPSTAAINAANNADTGTPAKASSTTYRICYRPYSGIFGKLATKMLATTLLAPQQMYIQIHLASATTFFNLSADPCRRIVGTIRDYVRNLGTANGQLFGHPDYFVATGTAAVANAVSPYYTNSSAYAPGYGPFHGMVLPELAQIQNPNLSAIQDNSGSNIYSTFSTAACSGRITLNGPVPVTGAAGGDLINVGGNVPAAQGVNAYSLALTNPAQLSSGLPATPQYMIALRPWIYQKLSCRLDAAGGTMITYAGDNQAFYGTYLTSSVPQSTRIFALDYKGDKGSGTMDTTTTYSLSNINLVGDQLILPNETTADIITQAEAGEFNVHTNSIRTYTLQINNSNTQTIICPLKVNMAKRILFVFQNMKARNSQTAAVYDSNCGLNPFALIQSSSNVRASNPNGHRRTFNQATGTATPGPLEGVGFKAPITYTPTPTITSSDVPISVQLRIGNDFYPPQPLTTMQEISAELCKTMEGWQNSTYSPEIDGSVVMNAAGALAYDCLQPSKFVTAFVANELLDDQTIMTNANVVPLMIPTVAGTPWNHATFGPGGVAATATSYLNGYNYMCPRGYTTSLFKSPSSRFVLGFNMRSFKSSDGVDGGTYLGNNTITLQLGGAVGLSATGETYRGLAIIPHRVAMRYSPGGQIVWAY